MSHLIIYYISRLEISSIRETIEIGDKHGAYRDVYADLAWQEADVA